MHRRDPLSPGPFPGQSIQHPDAARLARLNARIGELIGNAPQRPVRNPGACFGARLGQAAGPEE